MKGVNRIIKTLLFFVFVLNVSGALFDPLFAVFVKNFIVGATFATVGITIAIYSITKSVVQIPFSRFLDTRGNERGEYYAMIAGSAFSIIYPLGLLLASRPSHLFLLASINGIGAAFLMAAYYGMFSHHIDRKLQGYEWSLFSVGGLTVSTAIGALFGGIFTDLYGFRTVLLGVALMNTAATIFLALLLPFHRPDDRKKQ